MNNKPISQTILDENNINQDFIDTLASKLTDATHINQALRMFIRGQLPMSHIDKAESIDIPTIRKQIADVLRDARRKAAEHLAEQRRLSEYYGTCKMLKADGKNGVHFVFIKDGHIVAFGAQTAKDGGIYAANNPVHGEFKWTPNEHLARIRRFDKAFYKRIKKAAFAMPMDTWKMDGATIVKNGRTVAVSHTPINVNEHGGK